MAVLPGAKKMVPSLKKEEEAPINAVSIEIPDLEQPEFRRPDGVEKPVAILKKVAPERLSAAPADPFAMPELPAPINALESRSVDRSPETVDQIVSSENYDLIDEAPILQQVMSGATYSKASDQSKDKKVMLSEQNPQPSIQI